MQKLVYGDFLLESMLKPEIMEDMMAHCPLRVNQDGFERLEWVYAHYFLARQITALERKEILELCRGSTGWIYIRMIRHRNFRK